MIYQKCKHCGMDWHGIKLTHCPYCGEKTGYELPEPSTALRKRSFKAEEVMKIETDARCGVL